MVPEGLILGVCAIVSASGTDLTSIFVVGHDSGLGQLKEDR